MKDFNTYQFPILKSPSDHRDFLLESIYPDKVELPKVWDMRKDLMPVKDQGSQGSCSAQTAACMKEWQEKKDVQLNEYMSPQFVYNLRQNQGAEGMYPRDTMNILNKIGIVPEKAYPYLSRKKITGELTKLAGNYRIVGYAQVNTIDSLKKALYGNGPCYIAFPVFNANKMEFWKQDFKNQNSIGGHAVTVVGWLEDSFIIRNSWGEGWGDKGYTYYKFSDWGTHWEVWTALDADSNPEGLKKKLDKIISNREEKIGFFKRIFQKKIKK